MTIQIIDTHQHLWDLDRLHLPWVDEVPQLNRSFDLSDYQQYTQANAESEFAYEISQTLYMEVDVAENCLQSEIDLVLDLCRDPKTPMIGLVAPCRPTEPNFGDTLAYAQSNPEIKGFRRVLHTDATPPGNCLTGEFESSMKLLGEHSLPFDICIRREELADVGELAAKCSSTQFVLDHCGNIDVRISSEEWSRWKNDICRFAQQENVCCKISGFVWTIQHVDWSYEEDIEPVLRAVLDAFGKDRILFGGDWPVCTLSQLSFQQWLNAIYRFATEHDIVAPLFATNAQRIYNL